MSDGIQLQENTNTDFKCPKCGSVNIGCAETPGGGTNRWRIICIDCRWITEYGKTSDKEALEFHKDLLTGWDRGERPVLTEVVSEETEFSFRNRAAPLAEMFKGRAIPDGFRTKVAQERFANGEAIPVTFACLVCKKTEDGEQIADGFFRYPKGWRQRHPDGAAVCSSACMEKAGGAEFVSRSVRVFHCEACKKKDNGLMGGEGTGFFQLPEGWWMQEPQALVVCGVACVGTMRGVKVPA